MKKVLYATGFLAVCLVAVSFLVKEKGREDLAEMTAYENTVYGYSLAYPKGYELANYPGDYGKPDIREADSIVISKPGVKQVLHVLLARETMGKSVDSISLREFAQSVRDELVECDAKNGNVDADAGELENTLVDGKESFSFSFKEFFGSKNDVGGCGGFLVPGGAHKAYIVEIMGGTKFMLLVREGDLVSEAVFESIKFK